MTDDDKILEEANARLRANRAALGQPEVWAPRPPRPMPTVRSGEIAKFGEVRFATLRPVDHVPGACYRCHGELLAVPLRVSARGTSYASLFCDQCDAELRAEFDAKDREAEAERLRARTEAAWSSIPELFRANRFSTLMGRSWIRRGDAAVTEAQAALQGLLHPADPTAPLRPVTIIGGSQTGKTTLGCCMLAELLDQAARPDATGRDVWLGRSARYMVAEDLAQAHRNRQRGEIMAPLVEHVIERVSVLFLDRIGVESLWPGEQAIVATIVHTRHAARRPTILGVEIDGRTLIKRYGAGDAARIGAKGVTTLVFAGPVSAEGDGAGAKDGAAGSQ